LVDHPSDRKLHSAPVPYLGGLAIIAGFLAALAAGTFMLWRSQIFPRIGVIVGGGLVLAAMGLWDDRRVVPGWIKVPLELALAAGLFFTGIRVSAFGSVPGLDFIITIAWVIGITNALNYMDNMDGLTAGSASIAAACFALLAAGSGQTAVAMAAAALSGAAAGFLWHNRSPAKIFMGDAGSLFLGFALAGLGLELSFKTIEPASFLVPVVILAIPIMDALLVSASRVKRGLSPIHPGKDHVSHRLVSIGLAPPAAVRRLWLAGGLLGFIGTTMTIVPRTISLGIAVLVVSAAAAIGVRLAAVDP